ncbi:hypothetical protein BH23BAC4_BH23BAC4_11110 [soil metagenome]
MSRILLAILALALISLLFLNVQRQRIHDSRSQVAGELEMGARTVAEDVISRISTLPAGLSDSANGPVARQTGNASGIGANGFDDPALRTVDDFHGLTGVQAEQLVRNRSTGGPVTVTYLVDVDVSVVMHTGGDISQGMTQAKRIAVTVHHPSLSAPISLSRVLPI